MTVPGTPELAARHVPRWAWGSAAMLVLLVVATWDMIFEP